MALELAWAWRRFQPASALAPWYERRCGAGSARRRQLGLVALARKVLIALWRFFKTGGLPEGAVLTTAAPGREGRRGGVRSGGTDPTGTRIRAWGCCAVSSYSVWGKGAMERSSHHGTIAETSIHHDYWRRSHGLVSHHQRQKR
jgi:hypothetical protein